MNFKDFDELLDKNDIICKIETKKNIFFTDCPNNYGIIGQKIYDNFIEDIVQKLNAEGYNKIKTSNIISKDHLINSGHYSNFSNILKKCMVCKKEYFFELETCCSQTLFETKSRFGAYSISENLFLRPELTISTCTYFLNRLKKKKQQFKLFQLGESYRNEFRTQRLRYREFTQLEICFFIEKDNVEVDSHWTKTVSFFKKLFSSVFKKKFLSNEKKKLAHYALKTIDFVVKKEGKYFELGAISKRTDLIDNNHLVFEFSIGIDRLFYFFLLYSLKKEKNRLYFKFKKNIVPYKYSLILLKKDHTPSKELKEKIVQFLKKKKKTYIEITNSDIGKAYTYSDMYGIFYSIVIDPSYTLTEEVTIRDIKTKQQKVKKYTKL